MKINFKLLCDDIIRGWHLHSGFCLNQYYLFIHTSSHSLTRSLHVTTSVERNVHVTVMPWRRRRQISWSNMETFMYTEIWRAWDIYDKLIQSEECCFFPCCYCYCCKNLFMESTAESEGWRMLYASNGN